MLHVGAVVDVVLPHENVWMKTWAMAVAVSWSCAQGVDIQRGGWCGQCRWLKVVVGGDYAVAVRCRQGKGRPVSTAAAGASIKGPKWSVLTVTPGPFSSGS